MAEKKSLGQEFTKGLVKENPVLRLVLGTCPTLARLPPAVHGTDYRPGKRSRRHLWRDGSLDGSHDDPRRPWR